MLKLAFQTEGGDHIMKKPKSCVNVVVFDIDNTLIRGNITLFFLKLLIKEKFYFFRKCFMLLIKGAILIFHKLPSITKKILLQSGNVYRLDQAICHAVKKFYKQFFIIFAELNLQGEKLQQKARPIFSNNFFKKYLYARGLEKIKHHLNEHNTIIVLLSGSVQELVDSFFEKLCDQLDMQEITWRNRFFARGTYIEENGRIHLCIGSEKNKILKKLLHEKGYNHYALQFIYSDNSFMADLPLLIEAKHGGALISKKNELYLTLPKKLLRSFIFLPEWRKRPT